MCEKLDLLKKQTGYNLHSDLFMLAENYFGKNTVHYIGMKRLYNDNSFSYCFSDQKLGEMQFIQLNEPSWFSNSNVENRVNKFILVDKYTAEDLEIRNLTAYKEILSYLKIEKGIFLSRKFDNYIDTYFVSLKNTNSFNFYLSNIEKFENFYNYLYDEGNIFLKNICNTKIDFFSIAKAEAKKENLFDVKKLNKYYLSVDQNPIYLTEMEYKVIKKLSLGISSKYISEDLKISYKTVNAHIDNVKRKTNLHYKDNLISLFRNNSISLSYLK